MLSGQALRREFYLRDVHAVARDLLGKRLVHITGEGEASGTIVEVEAYAGGSDKGSHSYGGRRTPRTEIQFGPGGFAYVYMLYGVYCCFNAVANGEDISQVVLVRALRPETGLDLMKRRRGTDDPMDLCSGPGRLCQALGMTRAQNGEDLCGGRLFITDGAAFPDRAVMASPRVNIDYAGECAAYPWRYYIKDDPFVSKVPKKYRDAAGPYKS